MATVDTRFLDQLASAYQQSVSRIAIASEMAAIDSWYAHDSYVSDDDDDWSAAFWVIVLGAATAISALTREYVQNIGAYTGIMASLPSPDLSWLENDFENYYISPAVHARWLVGDGMDRTTAIRMSADRVAKLTSAVTRETELRAFEQMVRSQVFQVSWEYELDDRNPVPLFPATMEEADALAARSEHRVKRTKDPKFKRVPQVDACGWCRVVADRIYSLEAKERSPLGAWHNFCRCTWRKVTSAEAASFTPQYGDGQWRTVIKERFDETGDDNA